MSHFSVYVYLPAYDYDYMFGCIFGFLCLYLWILSVCIRIYTSSYGFGHFRCSYLCRLHLFPYFCRVVVLGGCHVVIFVGIFVALCVISRSRCCLRGSLYDFVRLAWLCCCFWSSRCRQCAGPWVSDQRLIGFYNLFDELVGGVQMSFCLQCKRRDCTITVSAFGLQTNLYNLQQF